LISFSFDHSLLRLKEIAMINKKKNEGVILEGMKVAGVEETIAPKN
jgi:hypothetical protein